MIDNTIRYNNQVQGIETTNGAQRFFVTQNIKFLNFWQKEAHIAAKKDQVWDLLQTDLSVVDFAENTPLHIAARSGSLRCVMYLSVDLAMIRNSFGEVPLDLVPEESHTCKWILDAFTSQQRKPSFMQELWNKTVAYLGQLDFMKTPRLASSYPDQLFLCQLYKETLRACVEIKKMTKKQSKKLIAARDIGKITSNLQSSAARYAAARAFIIHKLQDVV